MKYDGKVVVVTGAGSGMGRAMVCEFVAQGGRVAAVGRTLDRIRQTVELAGGPEKVMGIRADVVVEADVIAAIDGVIAHWGRIDRLCNNAGVFDSYRPAHAA